MSYQLSPLEQYRAKKKIELGKVIDRTNLAVTKKAYKAIEDFLSQTIDELIGCLPKERKFCQRNECSSRSVSIESGFNECRKEFEENLNKVSKKR